MITKLLENLLEKDFKDTFTPHPDEELLKRQKESGAPFYPLKPGDKIKVENMKTKGLVDAEVVGWPYMNEGDEWEEDEEWEVDFRFKTTGGIYHRHYAYYDEKRKMWVSGEGFYIEEDEDIRANESFEDVFKPASKDELKQRDEQIIQDAVDSGMQRLKPGDVFTIRPKSKVPGDTLKASSSKVCSILTLL